MASLICNLSLSPLLACQNRPFCPPIHTHSVSAIGGKQGRVAFTAKATSGNSESSTSLNVVESVKNVVSPPSVCDKMGGSEPPNIFRSKHWDKPEDRVALLGLGFASVVAFWASINVVTAIDKLPVVPGVFELIGILFSTWFVYRYLLFKPDRKELVQIINKSLSDILGQ